ncbi:MAG: HEAT repeat domain-containing protein [Anaerolineae bacterium]|nr:HEAT repeat domain-containing protein [Anaerolineae bacterium]
MVNEWDDNEPLGEEDPYTEIEALIDSNHPHLQEILADYADHPSWDVRVYAAMRLAELFQDVRAVPGLAEALESTDRHAQRSAAGLLWEIGDADTHGLLDTLYYAIGSTRDAVADALDRIGWQPDGIDIAVSYFIAARRWRDCLAMGKVAVPGLIHALHDPDGNVRRAAAWLLGKSGDPRAVPGLIELLEDTGGGMFGIGERVCDIAAEALERIGTPEALAAVEHWSRIDGSG